MKKGYLYYYKKWMEANELPDRGLCISLYFTGINLKAFTEFIAPRSNAEYKILYRTPYWGDNRKFKRYKISCAKDLTPLRETILLFCACINEEY